MPFPSLNDVIALGKKVNARIVGVLDPKSLKHNLVFAVRKRDAHAIERALQL
jgi:methyl coenzyme M reductase subunit D